MSQFQKQSLLDTLAQYLNSSDALKQVLNSPGLDQKGGKTLTRDGTKAVFVGQNTFKSGKKKGRFNKKGDQGKDGDNGGNSSKGGQSKKPKKNNSVNQNSSYYLLFS